MSFFVKLGILLAMIMASIVGTAQNATKKVYDMFEGKDGVSSMSLSKSAMSSYEMFLDDDTKDVLSKLTMFRFLNYDENDGQLTSQNVFDRIANEFNSSGYFTITSSEINCRGCKQQWNSSDALLWGRGSRSAMSEFHILLIDRSDCLLFSFFGNISIDDINKCAQLSDKAQITINMNK